VHTWGPQQTTNSLHTVLGADLTGVIPLGSERTSRLICAWAGCTSMPTLAGRSAAFAGAPSNAFTVYGAFEEDADAKRLAAVVRPKQTTREAEWASKSFASIDGAIQRRISAILKRHP